MVGNVEISLYGTIVLPSKAVMPPNNAEKLQSSKTFKSITTAKRTGELCVEAFDMTLLHY